MRTPSGSPAFIEISDFGDRIEVRIVAAGQVFIAQTVDELEHSAAVRFFDGLGENMRCRRIGRWKFAESP